jgi:hypothetical protein
MTNRVVIEDPPALGQLDDISTRVWQEYRAGVAVEPPSLSSSWPLVPDTSRFGRIGKDLAAFTFGKRFVQPTMELPIALYQRL